MKHIIRKIQFAFALLTLIGCGVLPPLSPEAVDWPAVVQCADIPGVITEVSEVLLNGGSPEDWEAVGRKRGEQGIRDLLCATEQLVEDWGRQAEGGSLSEDSLSALERAREYVEATGTKVER